MGRRLVAGTAARGLGPGTAAVRIACAHASVKCFETKAERRMDTRVERTLDFVHIGREALGFVRAGILLVLEVHSLRIAVAVVPAGHSNRRFAVVVGDVGHILDRSPVLELHSLDRARENRTGLAVAVGRSLDYIDRKVQTW